MKTYTKEKLKNNIIDKVKEYIKENDNIVVGVSGGPDSMALLFTLIQIRENLNININVAHINHMIREESKEEKKYIQEYCKNNDINFYLKEEDVSTNSKINKQGIEEYSRNIRYEFFKEVLTKTNSNKILTAHNLDDNIETVLLNIIRGTSLKGLCGIEDVSENLIRPLLSFEKTEILEFCKTNNIKYYIDKTNLETIYTRNKVRLDLIPKLEEYNMSFKKSMNKLIEFSKNDEQFINNYVLNKLNEIIIEKTDEVVIFNTENFNKYEINIKQRIIKEIIRIILNNVVGIEYIHIMDIIKLIENNTKGKKYIIGNKFEVEILKKYNVSIRRRK